MFKKLLIALSMLSLMACVTYYPYPQYEPKFDPSFDQHKYPRKPKSKEPSQYKISTEQMYQFILAENNMYSCLESQLGKQQEQRLEALEKQVLKELSYEQLVKVIGKEKAKTIYDDPQSFRYFQFKYQQLKHDISNIRERDCRLLTERYQYLWGRAKKTTELEESRDTSIQGRIQEQKKSIERRIQEQQESLERRIREQQEEMEQRMKSPF
ncbi:hypothetical protein K7G90_000156 [Pasteurella canis]|uniref:DUF5358 family protein n=1 Tax=Pasteurella canis TaxID=753 RepID=UPI001CC694C8|nr:DUF5358 family protein [Pasteurella canis]UAY77915.1 hypothetical protein K7G90_000156 [Pasteurella canis]